MALPVGNPDKLTRSSHRHAAHGAPSCVALFGDKMLRFLSFAPPSRVDSSHPVSMSGRNPNDFLRPVPTCSNSLVPKHPTAPPLILMPITLWPPPQAAASAKQQTGVAGYPFDVHETSETYLSISCGTQQNYRAGLVALTVRPTAPCM
jgi:hypothetical protein